MSGILAFLGNYLPDRLIPIAVVGLIVFLPSLFFAGFYLKRARLSDRRIAAVTAQMPEGVPVLYLRSFDDDKAAAVFRGDLTEEEQLVRALTPIGPVIAIGKPGESLPLAGAHRLYVTDDRWQAEVASLMQRARLIVIRSGLTPGLAWELDTVLRLDTPSKLMLLADSRAEIVHLLEQILKFNPAARTMVDLPRLRLGSMLGFVVFDASWRARLLPLRRWWAYFSAKHEDGSLMYAAIVHSLRPLYAQLSVPAPRLKLDYKKIGTLTMLAGFVIFGIVVSLL